MNRGGRDRVGGSFRYHRSGTGGRDGAGVGSCNYTLSVQKKTSCYVIIRKILLIKFPQLIFVGNCILTGAFPLPRPPRPSDLENLIIKLFTEYFVKFPVCV